MKYSELNRELHRRVGVISGQHVAIGLLDRLHGQFVRHQFHLALRPGRPKVSLAGHLAIPHAVADRRPADIVITTTTSPSSDGAFGELLATSLVSRGVRGLVMGAGLRDTQELRHMSFPAWTAHASTATACAPSWQESSTSATPNTPGAPGRAPDMRAPRRRPWPPDRMDAADAGSTVRERRRLKKKIIPNGPVLRATRSPVSRNAAGRVTCGALARVEDAGRRGRVGNGRATADPAGCAAGSAGRTR